MNINIPASAAPISRPNLEIIENVRRSVTYHPTIWGDTFLAYDSHLTDILEHEEQEHQKLKEEVKKLLSVTPNESLHKLDLIDAIGRLGVGYHFQFEVASFLKYAYQTSCSEQDCDLHTMALRFRLLREQGYYVRSDVFNKFKNQQGEFDESLSSDVQGLLSLFEASQYRVHGEEILEEALNFSITQLNSIAHGLSNSLSTRIREALDIPIRKAVPRLGARNFLSIYQEDESHNDTLLNFAKVDFNMLQKMHQKELSEVTRWWKALEIENKLPFARDRLVECYFWALTSYFEPQYSRGRQMLAKVIAAISIIDDIFDVYGTLDELTLLMDAIERWDIGVINQLPEYMQHYYKALLDVYTEIEEELGKVGKPNLAHYVIEEKKRLCRTYFEEAKWMYNSYIPTLEEYMKVAKPSSTYILLASTAFAGTGGLMNKEAFEWIASDPLILQSSEIIGRLLNDVVGFGFEQKISAITCYMNENKGATKEGTFTEIQKQVTKSWKDINQEYLSHRAIVPNPTSILLEIVVNLARVSHLVYRDIDDYTISEVKLKDIIVSTLVQPVPLRKE